VVECLLCKCETLSSNTGPTKRKEGKREGGREERGRKKDGEFLSLYDRERERERERERDVFLDLVCLPYWTSLRQENKP
jgi:hypothetical protein